MAPAAGSARFCVAGAAFQGLLIACGGTNAFLLLIACGSQESIACGGMWVSLMPGYKNLIACGSMLLRLLHSRMQGRFYEEGSDITVAQIRMHVCLYIKRPEPATQRWGLEKLLLDLRVLVMFYPNVAAITDLLLLLVTVAVMWPVQQGNV